MSQYIVVSQKGLLFWWFKLSLDLLVALGINYSYLGKAITVSQPAGNLIYNLYSTYRIADQTGCLETRISALVLGTTRQWIMGDHLGRRGSALCFWFSHKTNVKFQVPKLLNRLSEIVDFNEKYLAISVNSMLIHYIVILQNTLLWRFDSMRFQIQKCRVTFLISDGKSGITY